MSDVIDLGPRLKHRRQKDCAHQHITVDDEIADLECDDCGAQLDPWWYIRRLSNEPDAADEYSKRLHEECAKKRVDFEAWRISANAQMDRLNAEIRRLHDVKNELQNQSVTTVDGVFTLGTLVARMRRRLRKDRA